MPDIFTFILVFLLGIVTGFVDSTIGSGGLISIPSLTFLGLPLPVAIATDRLGTIGQEIAAFLKFRKTKEIIWKYVPWLSIVYLGSACIGANLLLQLDADFLQKLVGILLVLLLPLVFLKKDLGIEPTPTSYLKKALGFLLLFGLMIFQVFFGTGAGTLVNYTFLVFFGFTMMQIRATLLVPWFVLSVSSLVIFTLNGIVDWQRGIILLVGMAIGGYLGTHVIIQQGNKWLMRLFVIIVLFSSVRLLFF